MAQGPYAYDKNPAGPPSAVRFYIGVGLLVASLVLIGVVLWELRAKRGPMPVEDGIPGEKRKK